MSSHDSAQIRRQIGALKRQLQRHVSTVVSTLKEYNVEPTNYNFNQIDEDELESFRYELKSIKDILMKTYTSIIGLHDKWTLMQQSDANERTIFEDYIRKYGDYRDTITDTVTHLEQCDELLNAIDMEYARRKLNPPSDSSEASQDGNDTQWQPQSQEVRGSTTLPPNSTPHNRHFVPSNVITDSNLLNFVDASILSKLELPTFDGNLLDYPEFKARFDALVGNKPQLDDTTKFSLLKSCLRGKALQSIHGLSMTEGNYQIARDILKTLFDDEVTLKHILYTKLAQLPPCDEEGRHLASLYNQMFSLVRQFSKGRDDSTETGLGALLLNKLPFRVRSQIYDRTAHSHNVTPSELLNLLTDIVRKDSTLYEMEYHSRPQRFPDALYQGFHATSKPVQQPAKPSQRKSNAKSNVKKCPYCHSFLHVSIECTVFATPKQRREQAKIHRLCYNCLSSLHSTKECKSKRFCRFCSRRHHSSLCFLSNRGQATDQSHAAPALPARLKTATSSPRIRRNHSQQRTHAHFVEMSADSADANCSSSQIQAEPETTSFHLLVESAVQRNPSRQLTVTAFLDSGSNKSYITNEAAAVLGLSTQNCEQIMVSTFGTDNSLTIKCGNHTVGLLTEKGEQLIDVKSVPKLTGTLQQVQFSDDATQTSQTRAIQRNPILMEKYSNIFSEQLQRGIIERVPDYQLRLRSHYLSHHGVVKGTAILHNTYVDNVFYGVKSLNDGITFYKESRKLFNDAGMNLRAFASNSEDLNEYFENDGNDKVAAIQNLLGLKWDTSMDTLTIHFPKPVSDTIWTKRKVLKHVASMYDPLGLFAPVILVGKLFLQSLWKSDMSWDDVLPAEKLTQWTQIISSWTAGLLTFPRLIFNIRDNSVAEYDLHVFTDASASAYCASAYMVRRLQNCKPEISLIMSKSRLAPLNQPITIPRLELAAVTIGAKLLSYLVQAARCSHC
ncbi:Pao retrotransposon peptidase [Ostertagia ostertagi]